MATPLEIHTIVSEPFAENTYVVWQPARQDALVIDPGLEPELILDFLREQDLTRRVPPEHARPRRPHRRQRCPQDRRFPARR